MSEQDRDAERIMMNMHSGSRIVSSLLFADVEMIMRLWTFMKRMQRENILNKGEVVSFEKFIKATQGKYNIYQIPITTEDRKIGNAIHMRSLKDQLNELKLRYHVLPDLNNSDGMAQIAVFRDDQQKFSVWYGNYLNAHMSGGEKSLQDLNNLTNRHISIISMPCEGMEQKLKEDFSSLNVNYTILPDLNVGDGNIQMYIANADLNKVEHWFKLYKEDQMKEGKEVGEMKVVSQEDYQETGRLDEEEYISTGDKEVQMANEKYEGQEKGDLEKAVGQMSQTIRSKDDISYQKYHSNSNFYEITINHQTLVEKSHFPTTGQAKADEKGLFASRVPGTWGGKERTLLLPKDQVFSTDDGKTYIGFISKSEKPIVIDTQNKQVSIKAGDLYENAYKKVSRGFKQKSQLTKEQKLSKDTRKQPDIASALSSEHAKDPEKGKDKFNNFQGRKYENINELEKLLLMKK